MIARIPRAAPGSPISAAEHNQMLEAHRSAVPISSPGMLVEQLPQGFVARTRRHVRSQAAVPLRLQFAARLDVDSSGTVLLKVFKGYRQRIGSNPVLCAPASGDEFSFTYVSGQAIWTVFTYRTTESGVGTWDSTLQSGSSIPDDNQSQRVFIIARMADASGAPDFLQEITGPLAVYDILNESACS